MQLFPLLAIISTLVAQPGAIDLQKEPFAREMAHNLELLQGEMNLTATAEPVPSYFRTQTSIKASEEALIMKMVGYSAAAYCFDLTLQPWACRHCQDKASVELVTIKTDMITGGRGYVALDHAMKTIVVAFQGTADPRSFLNDLNFSLVDLEVGDGTPGIRVHTGFLRYADGMGHKLIPVIEDLLSQYNYSVTLTGHSIGGAVATLTGIYTHKHLNVPWSSINLVTFGEPRIGNEAFSRWFNTKNSGHLRVVNKRDMVVHLPLSSLGFVHRRREIFVADGAMNSCISEDLEDPDCGASMKHFLSIWDHFNYLGTTMGLIC